MQKPDFLITGYMVNDCLLAPYRDELLKCLPSRLKNHESIDEFLRAVSAVVHNSEMSALPQNPNSQDTVAPPSKARDTAMEVVKQAAHLQEALAALRRDALMDFDGQFTGTLHQRDRNQFIEKMNDRSTPEHEINGDAFLAKLWNDLALLKEASSKIADNANVSPHSQPSKAHAKNIARGVAENWLRCFGEMPKADPNDASKTTFTKFLKALASELPKGATDHARLSLYSTSFTIGPTVAKEAVDKLEGG
jgi:hypothetical protein